MSINIVSFQKTPDSSYSIYKESKEKYRAILKGAAIEIPWEDERIVFSDIFQSYSSWKGYISKSNSYEIINHMHCNTSC